MEELLQQVVSLHGVQVGYVVDVIVDAARKKPIGLEVRCEDGRHRFLPMAAASSSGGEIVIDSPFALLDGDELDFYRQRHATLRNRREPAA